MWALLSLVVSTVGTVGIVAELEPQQKCLLTTESTNSWWSKLKELLAMSLFCEKDCRCLTPVQTYLRVFGVCKQCQAGSPGNWGNLGHIYPISGISSMSMLHHVAPCCTSRQVTGSTSGLWPLMATFPTVCAFTTPGRMASQTSRAWASKTQQSQESRCLRCRCRLRLNLERIATGKRLEEVNKQLDTFSRLMNIGHLLPCSIHSCSDGDKFWAKETCRKAWKPKCFVHVSLAQNMAQRMRSILKKQVLYSYYNTEFFLNGQMFSYDLCHGAGETQAELEAELLTTTKANIIQYH